MNPSSNQTILESRAGRSVYMVPLILAGSAVSLGVAWILMQLVVDDGISEAAKRAGATVDADASRALGDPRQAP